MSVAKRTKRSSTMILPPPTAKKGNEFPLFLKAKDISENGTTDITLLGDARPSTSRFGEGVDLACKIGSKAYTWSVKFDSVNYRLLYEQFGQKQKWIGDVKVERKKWLGNEYVAVVE